MSKWWQFWKSDEPEVTREPRSDNGETVSHARMPVDKVFPLVNAFLSGKPLSQEDEDIARAEVERIAETDDRVLEKYLSGENFSSIEIERLGVDHFGQQVSGAPPSEGNEDASELGNIPVGRKVLKTGTYQCAWCGSGGVAAQLEEAMKATSGLSIDLGTPSRKQKTRRYFTRGDTFDKCPNCGPDTGWTFLDPKDVTMDNS